MGNYTARITYAGMIPVEDNSPVVFIHEGGINNRTELWPGIFSDGRIYYDEGSLKGSIISFKPERGTFFPVGTENFKRLSHAYLNIMDKLDATSKDESLLYQNCLPPIDDVWEGKISWDEYEAGMQKNEERIKEIDRIQRDKGETLYRFIRFGVADGFAVYQITDICGSIAKVKLCRGLGDDYVYEPYGESADVKLSEIEAHLKKRNFFKGGTDMKENLEMFECTSEDCAYNNSGECRFCRVFDKDPTITEKDGCIDFVVKI